MGAQRMDRLDGRADRAGRFRPHDLHGDLQTRRAEGKEDASKGPGASWEGAIIRLDLYEANGINDKFVPILIRNEDKIHRPKFLRDYS